MNTFFKEIDNNIKNMEWPVIMPDQFHDIINSDDKIAIIDVRKAEDANFDKLVNQIFGSQDNHIDYINLEFQNFVSQSEEIDFSIYKYAIIICGGGPKSAVAASIKRWAGKDNFYFVKGGVMEFKETYL